MQKKILSLLVVSCSILIFSCSEECTTTTHVGGRDRPVMIVNSSGGNVGIYTTNGNGDVTHPCETSVGIGQNQFL